MKTSAIANWVAMLKRWSNGAPCESNTCTAKGWDALVAKVKAAGDPMAQIKTANSLMNDPAQQSLYRGHQQLGQDPSIGRPPSSF